MSRTSHFTSLALAAVCSLTIVVLPALPALASLPAADVGVSLSDVADPVKVGTTTTFTVVVANSGPGSATNVVVSVPAEFRFDRTQLSSSQGSCGTTSCSLGTLGSGATTDVTVTRRATATGPSTHWASVTSDADNNSGNDSVFQIIVVNTGPCTISGTAGADVLTGTAGADVICGLQGADRIDGVGGADVLVGGDGNDRLTGASGTDVLIGNERNDIMTGNAADDIFDGGSGVDSVAYGKAPSGVTVNLGSFTASGGDGNDVFVAIGGMPTIENAKGSGRADTLIGNGFDNRITGYGGNDILTADQGGDDVAAGGAGLDTIDVADGLGGDTANGGKDADSCASDVGDTLSNCP